MLCRLGVSIWGVLHGSVSALPIPAAVAAATQQAAAACGCTLLQHHQHQQQHQQQQQQQSRAYAAAKAKGKQQQKGGSKGQKGQAAPKKKSKQQLDAKPLDEKDPLLQRVVSMLVPQERKILSLTPEQVADAQRRAKEYSSRKMAEHKAWRSALHEKLTLKRAALLALPPALREHAKKEDLEPFPLMRHFLYETPPEAYRS